MKIEAMNLKEQEGYEGGFRKRKGIGIMLNIMLNYKLTQFQYCI